MYVIDKEKLILSYEKYQSVRKVGLDLGISHETARYKLKKLGILNKPIRYKCNEDFFKQNTLESLYWSGFMAADGCVKLGNKKYKQISMELSSKDRGHIEKFKEVIKFDGPISTKMANGKYEAVEIHISSDKLFNDLARFNIVPRKSLILTFPEWLIEHELVNHFMRGYFDGDGSFYCQKLEGNRTVRQLMFSLRGTKEFLTIYKNILEKKCKLETNDRKPRLNSGIYTLEYGGNRKVQKIRNFLYNNSVVETRLDRKYNLAHSESFNLPENFNFSPVVAINIETDKNIFFKSISEAISVGFIGSRISFCCKNGNKYTHKGYTWKYL